MKYYYLKVGSSNCLAKQWLDGKNPVAQRPAVVVFFGKADEKCSQKKYSSEEYKRMGLSSKRGGYQLNQLESFYNACDRPNCSRFVVVAEKLWILTPKGKVERQELGGLDLEDLVTWYGLEIKKRQPKGKTFDEERKKFLENESPKYCEVEIKEGFELSKVPHILASMSGAQNFNRPTICEISSFGNCKALDYLCLETKSRMEIGNDFLKCLSPGELETLIAKIFESYGCHVPAYSGKNMARVDLFARNCTNEKIVIPGDGNCDDISIEVDSAVGIQVKAQEMEMDVCVSKPPVDYLVHLGISCRGEGGRPVAFLGGDWIREQLRKDQCKTVRSWLAQSLYWVEFDKDF